ncbi:MAG: PHP domain-containing protein, partial [Candidatus Colwellbacteria bacterium]|nr:PHP domain-containing protein [Candidatus Colwellbacteria bacterium]
LIAAGKLENLPGFGKKMQEKIKTSIESKFIKEERMLLSEATLASEDLLNYLRKIKEVEKLIAAGKLENLPGFGKKMQEKIKTSIESKFIKEERMLLSEATLASEDLLNYLRKIKEVDQVEPLGSLRRHVATVGDIDIGISTANPNEVMREIQKYQEINKVISSGESVSRIKLKNGHEVDIKLCAPNEWGSLLHHYTGSKLHNIALRSYSLEKHLSLSERGIKNLKTGKIFRPKNEKEFYAHLGLPYIPPELREGEEEISFAKKGKVLNLVELNDIRGDLHIHSDFDFDTSHDLGRSKLSEYLDKARNLEYEYLGISDHNPKFSGTTTTHKRKTLEDRKKTLLTQYYEYEKKVKTRVPKLLIGLEIDIRADGELAIDEGLSDFYDYAIVSIHTSFDLNKDENTKRIIKALSQPKAIILGHPTTRKLNQRKGIDADWEEIIKFCKQHDKILEVNATPDRLDLPDDLIKMAVRSGVKLIINSDSHDVSQLDFMKFGVWTARRGWARKNDVVNTFPYKNLQALLQ